jgi:type II secretory pathway pseudopilin PulG
MKGERGTSLVETAVALALLGLIGLPFLSTVATTSNARLIADEHAAARILAESRLEDIRQQEYAFSYDTPPITEDGYSTEVVVDNLRNEQIQKITVTVSHHGRGITTLESYKTNR